MCNVDALLKVLRGSVNTGLIVLLKDTGLTFGACLQIDQYKVSKPICEQESMACISQLTSAPTETRKIRPAHQMAYGMLRTSVVRLTHVLLPELGGAVLDRLGLKVPTRVTHGGMPKRSIVESKAGLPIGRVARLNLRGRKGARVHGVDGFNRGSADTVHGTAMRLPWSKRSKEMLCEHERSINGQWNKHQRKMDSSTRTPKSEETRMDDRHAWIIIVTIRQRCNILLIGSDHVGMIKLRRGAFFGWDRWDARQMARETEGLSWPVDKNGKDHVLLAHRRVHNVVIHDSPIKGVKAGHNLVFHYSRIRIFASPSNAVIASSLLQ